MGWGPLSAEYIAAKVSVEDRGYKTPCLIWRGAKNAKGYGRAVVPGCERKVRVHRVAYEIAFGPIPEGLVTDHLCRVTSCCNPYHLEIVTVAENTARGNRCRFGGTVDGTRTHCAHGHPNIPENRQPSGNCRPCSLAAAKRHRERKMEVETA